MDTVQPGEFALDRGGDTPAQAPSDASVTGKSDTRRAWRPGMSVGGRMTLGFTCMVLMLVGVAALGGMEFRSMGQRLHQIVKVNNPKSDLAHQMLIHINELATQARSVALLTDTKEIEAEVKLLKVAEQNYLKAEKTLIENIGNAGATEDERRLMEEITAAAKATLPLVMQAAKQGQEGANIEAATTLMEAVRPKETIWRQKVGEMVAAEVTSNGAAYEQALAGQQRALGVAGVAVSAAVIAGVLLGWRTTRSVTRPIDSAISVAERIAAGDLSSEIQIQSTDEIGRLLLAISAMQDHLCSLVGEIRTSAEHIRAASSDVASGNLDLSTRTEMAAANLQETASSISQLTDAVRRSVESSLQASRLASSASDVATHGGKVFGEVVSTMEEINSSSGQIADIVGVIDGIAFQTNILALNAAVEAARAGEQGRGFAVVAGEVRALAQRSAEAAKAIKVLIGNSQTKVAAGSKRVTEAGLAMTEIVESGQRVSDIIGEIRSAATAQLDDIVKVSDAVTQLDQMTQQNAALVEQSASASGDLKEQAHKLTSTVSTFRLRPTMG